MVDGGGATNVPPKVTTAPLGVTQRLLLLGALAPEPEPEPPREELNALVASIRDEIELENTFEIAAP
jgi:hypothetical protein